MISTSNTYENSIMRDNNNMISINLRYIIINNTTWYDMIFLLYFYDIISSYNTKVPSYFLRLHHEFHTDIQEWFIYTALYMEANQFTWDLSNLNDITGRNSTRRAVPLTCLCFYLIRRYLRKNYWNYALFHVFLSLKCLAGNLLASLLEVLREIILKYKSYYRIN